jgi:DNA-binding MurR/RpiR family transcriptional regulator
VNKPIEIDTPASAHVLAEREARFAAEGIEDAAEAVAEDEVAEAVELLDEAARRIAKAKQYLGDVIAAGKPAGGAR